MSEEAKVPFACRLKPGSLERLKKLQEKNNLTPSVQADLAVEEYLNRLDGGITDNELTIPAHAHQLTISAKELTRAAGVVEAMGSPIPIHLLLEIFKHQNKE